MQCAGIKLGPGTYHVTAKVEDGYHINLACSQSRHMPFEVDFASVFFYFTVRQPQASCHPGIVCRAKTCQKCQSLIGYTLQSVRLRYVLAQHP